MDRRNFLKGLLIGCSAAASPLLTPVTFASAPGEGRLVVIILRGAMDGLDALQPYGDRDFAALRPDLALQPDQGTIDLDGFFALHPAAAPLLPLWQAGELAFAHATSTPYRDKRSHFDGQDLLEAGIAGNNPLAGSRDGWLNRLLQNMPGSTGETAYTVGSGRMLILSGDAPSRGWAPRSNFALSEQAQLLLDHVYHDDPLFRDAAANAILEAGTSDSGNVGSGPTAATENLAAFTASRLNEQARIASFSIAGWDSHANQPRIIGRALANLSAAILRLKADLGRNWAQTTVIAMTEFGRTARQNGSQGTDHGTGGALFMAGGALKKAQVLGQWPGLAESDLYAGRDLMPTRDVRAYAGWALRGMFGIETSMIEGVVFPGLDMGGDPGLLA